MKTKINIEYVKGHILHRKSMGLKGLIFLLQEIPEIRGLQIIKANKLYINFDRKDILLSIMYRNMEHQKVDRRDDVEIKISKFNSIVLERYMSEI